MTHLSNPKPGHTTGRSGRGGARRGGGAGRSWVGRDAVGSIRPGDNPPSCPPANREHCPERLCGSTNSLIRTYLSNPKPGHTTGGSGRGARRNGRAGSGGIGCQQTCSARKHKSRVPSKGSQKRRLSVPRSTKKKILCTYHEHQMSLQTHDQTPRTSVRKHERIKSHVNRLEEHDERLTTG